MKKILVFLILTCFAAAPVFSQKKITPDNAISDFAADFISRFPSNRSIAVIAFETDNRPLMIHFIDTMVERLLKGNPNADVFERQRIENLQKELDFSLTGLVSDKTAHRIGHFTGADKVIYGTLKKTGSGNTHRMTVSAAITEAGQILLQELYDLRHDSLLADLLGDNSARLWAIGISAGSSFSQPLLIGTIHGTIAPFRYSFLELGFDAGIFSRKPDEDYYSISPFAHCAIFWPFDKGGLYAGAGVTMILDNNITLQGHNTNTTYLVLVHIGSLIMKTGSMITGNNGGVSSAFTKTGGTIYGGEAGSDGNTATSGRGHAVQVFLGGRTLEAEIIQQAQG